AEDGIRYLTVTGVQTCALPIFHHGLHGDAGFIEVLHFEADDAKHEVEPLLVRTLLTKGDVEDVLGLPAVAAFDRETRQHVSDVRSEERRVGKECGSGWLPGY